MWSLAYGSVTCRLATFRMLTSVNLTAEASKWCPVICQSQSLPVCVVLCHNVPSLETTALISLIRCYTQFCVALLHSLTSTCWNASSIFSIYFQFFIVICANQCILLFIPYVPSESVSLCWKPLFYIATLICCWCCCHCICVNILWIFNVFGATFVSATGATFGIGIWCNFFIWPIIAYFILKFIKCCVSQ